MNKTVIKNFAVWARNKLIADITYRAGLVGVSDKGIAQPLPQSSKDLQFFDIGTKDYAQIAGKEVEQRKALVKAIQDKEHDSDYATAFKAVIEEVAYTWFNRLIAIRFMEVNDYLPSRVRVLSSENQAKNEPDFVTTPFDTDMEFTTAEQDRIMQLKDENKLDDLFRMLFIKQCNKLHEILPELFENTNDYTELLLSISFTDSDGIVYHLVHDIDEDDFNIEKEGQVEIIGWMYQYYNIEPKDETFALLKKNVKITKERIPAATQLFTPDWIVRYMVENSLGRLWVEGHPNEDLKGNWKYYLEEAEQEADVQVQLEKIRADYRNLNPEDIKVIDPCMGSGHILVYCFDVLMQIYESQGYAQRDAAQSILENNLFGLDIDKRAAQLSYFAVMMKARQYDRRIFGREIKPHVYVIEESNDVNRSQLKYFGAGLNPVEKNSALNETKGLLETLVDAKEYGSILNVDNYDWDLLRRFVNEADDSGQMTLDTIGIDETKAKLCQLIEIGQIMSQKYDVVVTNPPYMGSGGMDEALVTFLKENYEDSRSDMFSVFIVKCLAMVKKTGLVSMITQPSWLFLTSFEKMRKRVVRDTLIQSMLHMGRGIFGIDFGSVAFTLRKASIDEYAGSYFRLHKKNFQYLNPIDIQNIFLSAIYDSDFTFDFTTYKNTDEENTKILQPQITGKEQRIFYVANQNKFQVIESCPVAYWCPKSLFDKFSGALVGNVFDVKSGLSTGDNELFVRNWFEISADNFTIFNQTGEWVPYNKGGGFRKWFGVITTAMKWGKEGNYVREYGKAVFRNPSYYFREGVTWTGITSGIGTFRFCPEGYIFDSNKGPMIFEKSEDLYVLLGFLNSNVANMIIKMLNPTVSIQIGDIVSVPYCVPSEQEYSEVRSMVVKNIEMLQEDWNEKEISWGYARALLAKWQQCSLTKAWNECETFMISRSETLRNNEEKINEIYIQLFDLAGYIDKTVPDEELTVAFPDKKECVISLLSYAVGCMFGRYSLDVDGLAYAGGEWDDSKYSTFIPDKDNCIPITDEPYFEDDIVGLFCAWLKKVYGEDTLEENLDFIANALGNKGSTSREVIRNYFLNDFIKDHIKIYQKRPIYWLFDSGKQNGFKALVYMHRWDADTVGNLRVEYLHKTQRIYEREIQRMQETMDNSHDSREINRASKRKEKLQKQLKETKDYDTMLAHIALSRIDIALDDGVKVNYEKVQTGRDGKKMQILAKI